MEEAGEPASKQVFQTSCCLSDILQKTTVFWEVITAMSAEDQISEEEELIILMWVIKQYKQENIQFLNVW